MINPHKRTSLPWAWIYLARLLRNDDRRFTHEQRRVADLIRMSSYCSLPIITTAPAH